MTLAYRVKLQEDDNGTLLVTCRALPEVTTFGDDEAAAMARARDAIEEALAARIGDGQDIPKSDAKGPHLVRLPALATLKVELYRQLRLAGLRGPNWPAAALESRIRGSAVKIRMGATPHQLDPPTRSL